MVLVIGESLVDIVQRPDGAVTEHPGGSPANVAVGLARLGVDALLATTLGDDGHGELVRRHLAGSGVRLMPGLRQVAHTSTAHAQLDDEGAATYTFDIAWDPGPIVPDEQPGVVHTGSIAALLKPGAVEVEAALQTLAADNVVTFDPNFRPLLLPDRESTRQSLTRLLPLSDVVKVSDEDLAWLAPEADPIETARSWLDAGPAVVIVTCGAHGAVALTPTGSLSEPSLARRVVDTVGAGDSFMAGLISALVDESVVGAGGRERLERLDESAWRRIVDVASQCSAFVVEREGASPPWRAELDA